MRPIYENSASKEKEQAFAEKLCSVWNFCCKKLPISYHLDYALFRKGSLCVSAWLELKCRTNDSNKYDTYIISLNKVLVARRIFEVTGLPTVLAVRFQDCDKYTRLSDLSPKMLGKRIAMGGRKDRNDWQDVEPVCHIPMAEFKGLSK